MFELSGCLNTTRRLTSVEGLKLLGNLDEELLNLSDESCQT